MKIKFISSLSAVLCLLLCAAPITAYAADYSPVGISPALNMIAENEYMVKSGLVYSDVKFTAADFDRALGVDSAASITIRQLPPSHEGTLMLGEMQVSENQVISRSNMEQLRFVPAQEGELESSFTFCPTQSNGTYEIPCHVKIISEVNFAPTTKIGSDSVSAWTQSNITYFGTLKGSDPEGDALKYEIVSYPKKGIVTITSDEHGDFKYTPYAGSLGSDRFSYTVRDEYGNYSEIETVTIKIERPAANIVFSDMSEHWAHNAAIVMASKNIMNGEVSDDGVKFYPNEPVSRTDFLVMVMKALGAEDVPTVERTGFADDAAIPVYAKGYVAAALRLGIIKGDEREDGRYFYPASTITRAEAAVILNNIIGAEVPVAAPVFADQSDIPTWAESSLYALNQIGVMKGTGNGYISPYDKLNRAQTAQIIMTLLDINN